LEVQQRIQVQEERVDGIVRNNLGELNRSHVILEGLQVLDVFTVGIQELLSDFRALVWGSFVGGAAVAGLARRGDSDSPSVNLVEKNRDNPCYLSEPRERRQRPTLSPRQRQGGNHDHTPSAGCNDHHRG
jgi:hypothetical protein